jgi:uncharacterized protein involved in cysteine biosynthesis
LFGAIAKTLGQLNDPPIRRVIGKTLGLAILGYILFVVLVYLLIGWLSGLTGWMEGLAQFGGVAFSIVIAWFIFPAAAAANAGLFADEVIDAVEARHYPALPPAKPVPVLEAVVAFTLADALLEKLGGDSLTEMRPRFEKLRQTRLEDLPMDDTEHVWWS